MPKGTHASTAVASVATYAFGGADAGSYDYEIILSLLYGFFIPVAIAFHLRTYVSTIVVAQPPPSTTLFEERRFDARGTRGESPKGHQSHDSLHQHVPEKYGHNTVRTKIDCGRCHQGIGRAQGRSRRAPVSLPVLRRQRKGSQRWVLELSLCSHERRKGLPLHALSHRRQRFCGRFPGAFCFEIQELNAYDLYLLSSAITQQHLKFEHQPFISRTMLLSYFSLPLCCGMSNNPLLFPCQNYFKRL
jgi:hypothetical protein